MQKNSVVLMSVKWSAANDGNHTRASASIQTKKLIYGQTLTSVRRCYPSRFFCNISQI